MDQDMTRSITVALVVALASLAAGGTKQSIEDHTEARRHHQESIRINLRRLGEERDETAQATAVAETASAMIGKSAARMKEQVANQPEHPPEGEFSFWMMKGEREIVLSGYIAHGVARKLSELLAEMPHIRAIGLYSGGGRISEALKIQELIRSRNIDTYAYKQCLSACTIAFLGGANRYIDRGDQMGFHGSTLPDRVEFDSNPNRDRHLIREIIALGVDANFAEKAYMYSNKDICGSK